MPKPQPTLYDLRRTTFWFAVVSILLLICMVWMILDDHSREWKNWQRRFIALKTEKLKKEISVAQSRVDQERLRKLEERMKDAEMDWAEHREDHARYQREVRRLDTDIEEKKKELAVLKQYGDSYKYYYEEYQRRDRAKAEAYRKKMEGVKARLAGMQSELEEIESEREEAEGRLAGLEGETEKVKKEVGELFKEKTRLERSLEKVRPTFIKDILDAPLVDFMAPSLRIQQAVLDHLFDDYHFTKVQKVDRCMTCHLGIEEAGLEDAAQPFTAHPKLDLYVGRGSPHPFEEFGCTVCHGGNGRSVSFVDSAHTPDDEAQREAWKKRYGWRLATQSDPKMLPSSYVEASCTKCHANQMEIPGAPRLNEGRALVQTYGCFGCHIAKGFEEHWKIGPDLAKVGSKLDRDWMMRWLQDPKVFRPATRMPRVYHLSNMNAPEDRKKNLAAIEGIVNYLLAASEELHVVSAPLPSGDALRGKTLVGEMGCLGCHGVGEAAGGDFGPPLEALGSKVRSGWLSAWLKNPKHYAADTRMVDLRLTDQEIADMTHYLLASRDAAFDQSEILRADQAVVDEMAANYLRQTLDRRGAEQALAGMSGHQRLVFLGERLISHQGCYGCHTIRGFEDAKPIGNELTGEGSKDLHRFDFGVVDIEPTRHDWIFQKLKDPRSFDEGRVKDYLEKLRMPRFGFEDDQAEALTTFLLSLTDDPIPLEMQKQLDPLEERVEKGRVLVSKHNCSGCHSLDGKEGFLWGLTEDVGYAPPTLVGEGNKVQEIWLHSFLDAPSTVRPWLKVRMPSFHFGDPDLRDLVHYFVALDGHEVSYRGIEIPPTSAAKLEAGRVLFDKFRCNMCHRIDKQSALMSASLLAPDMELTKERLKPDWVFEWMKNPQKLQEGTMMPDYFPDGETPFKDLLGGDYLEQIRAIRDYLYRYSLSEDGTAETASE